MPSHISHSLLAEKLFESLGVKEFSPQARHAVYIGAQGPDIFYHNRRSSPSGLLAGSVIHRKGFGSVSARMLEHCLLNGFDHNSPQGVYTLAFISHGIMDRVFHPYINYFAGWVDGSAESENYRFCHPFLERILDGALACTLCPDNTDYSPGDDQPLNNYSFADKFDAGSEMPHALRETLEFALKQSYSRMSRDEQLGARIQNAYADSCGFYHYCEGPRSPRIPCQWAALLHPKKLPADIDFLNLKGTQWFDPCDQDKAHSWSVHKLFSRALEQATRICRPVRDILAGGDPPKNYPGLPAELGDHGLRSDVPGQDMDSPCTLKHRDPLPLKAVLEQIAAGTCPSHWKAADELFGI